MCWIVLVSIGVGLLILCEKRDRRRIYGLGFSDLRSGSGCRPADSITDTMARSRSFQSSIVMTL